MEIDHTNTNQKKAETASLISDKADFRVKIIRDKDRHYKMVKGSILQDLIILNTYVPNNRASKYMKQKLIELRGETDKLTTVVGDFNTPLSVTGS